MSTNNARKRGAGMRDDITFCANKDNYPEKDKCRRAEKPQYPEYASKQKG